MSNIAVIILLVLSGWYLNLIVNAYRNHDRDTVLYGTVYAFYGVAQAAFIYADAPGWVSWLSIAGISAYTLVWCLAPNQRTLISDELTVGEVLSNLEGYDESSRVKITTYHTRYKEENG